MICIIYNSINSCGVCSKRASCLFAYIYMANPSALIADLPFEIPISYILNLKKDSLRQLDRTPPLIYVNFNTFTSLLTLYRNRMGHLKPLDL